LPYFPVGKVAELLKITRQDIDEILGDHTEIVELCIGVEDFKTGEYETYVDPVGCALLVMYGDNIEKSLKVSMTNVFNLLKPGNLEKVKEYIDSDQAHPFVKELFRLSPECGECNDIWSKQPVQ
jgi:hypothetical protein